MGCGMRMSFGLGLGCLCYGWALQPSMSVWGMSRTMGPTRVGNVEGMGGWGSILLHTLASMACCNEGPWKGQTVGFRP